MPQVHTAGRFYVHRMTYPTRHFPLVERGTTHETSYPHRVGVSVVLRVPFSREAVVVGVWGPPAPEDAVLRAAIGARDVGRWSAWAV